MILKELIKKETILAMKNKDSNKVNLLRLINSFITNKEIDKGIKGKEDLDDDEVINILKSMIKSRENVIIEYIKVNDVDSINNEKEEIKIIETFLPTPYTEHETTEIVYNIIKDLNISSVKDIGLVMKNLELRNDKNKFNKALVSKIIREKLG